MHLLRLLASCRDLLRTGTLTIDVGADRESLLAVKRGEVPWAEVERRMARLADEADEAATRSPLPPEPDLARVEDFLIRTRRASALQPHTDDQLVQRLVSDGRVGKGRI
ncbi:hypothetical protein GA0115259_101524 [Streptomyces sp. MnatMP-M17]|nr:hypothetical protein GA0115259_101524 [Streptomyces sp. MnatMP-M17]